MGNDELNSNLDTDKYVEEEIIMSHLEVGVEEIMMNETQKSHEAILASPVEEEATEEEPANNEDNSADDEEDDKEYDDKNDDGNDPDGHGVGMTISGGEEANQEPEDGTNQSEYQSVNPTSENPMPSSMPTAATMAVLAQPVNGILLKVVEALTKEVKGLRELSGVKNAKYNKLRSKLQSFEKLVKQKLEEIKKDNREQIDSLRVEIRKNRDETQQAVIGFERSN